MNMKMKLRLYTNALSVKSFLRKQSTPPRTQALARMHTTLQSNASFFVFVGAWHKSFGYVRINFTEGLWVGLYPDVACPAFMLWFCGKCFSLLFCFVERDALLHWKVRRIASLNLRTVWGKSLLSFWDEYEGIGE
jgi:hypothetical protein